MLKTLAKDILNHPQEWVRKDDYLERSLTTPALARVRLQLFKGHDYRIEIGGNWYIVPWYQRRILTYAKKAWVKNLHNQVRDVWQQKGMTSEEWFKWRQSQVDKK